MKLPMSWLKGWVDPGLAPRELGDRMTLAGFELESIASAAPAFSGVVVAEILSAERHPQADKLQVCRVSIGGTELQIVCGAANARAGLRTALAQVGAVLPGDLKIKAAKLRGIESAGMLCSAKELGLAEVSDGILELPADLALGADLRAVLDLDDPLLEFAITPNRGDAMSVQGLAREVAALTGADADGVFDRGDEHLSVADLVGGGGLHDRVDDLGGIAIFDDDLEFDLGEKVDRVFRSTIDFGVAFLATESLHFADGHAVDTGFGEGFFDFFEFEGLDDGFDFFHWFFSSDGLVRLGNTV